jgi:cytidylate kinase
MIITLMGDIGSGKGTVAQLLKKELGYESIGVGDTWREIAAEKQFSIHEMNAYILQNPDMDKHMDEQTAKKARNQEHCIVDGRAQWYFLPESIKIYLAVDIQEAAKRIYDAKRSSEKENNSLESTLAHIKKRTQQDNARFKELYNIDIHDKTNYDLLIDTTQKTPEDVTKQILMYLKSL